MPSVAPVTTAHDYFPLLLWVYTFCKSTYGQRYLSMFHNIDVV